MTTPTRVALTGACVASALALAVVLGMSSNVDQDGNLQPYAFDTDVRLAFATLLIVAVCVSGAIGRPSQSSLVGGYLLFLAAIAYSVALVVRHPGEFDIDGLLAEIGLFAFMIVGVASAYALLGGLLGAAASVVVLGGRWVRDSVWSRYGPHFHHKRPMS